MADGTTKAISQIKVGDMIANSVPGAAGIEAHKVTDVIVTQTDHDFVDLAVKKKGAPAAEESANADIKSLAKKTARKAAFGLAASAAVLGALSAGHGHGDAQKPAAEPVAAVSKNSSARVIEIGDRAKAAHLTTTFHHPFYDETQSAFVDAEDVSPGDVLQTPTGTAEVTGVRLFHANTTTYDLTIGDLHTYYVEAGDTPVLVHNLTPEECQGAVQGMEKITSGVLDVQVDVVPFSSGRGVGGFIDDMGSRVPGMTSSNEHHVEMQAAAYMRANEIKRGVLYINHPDGVCAFCSGLAYTRPGGTPINPIEDALPKDAMLWIYNKSGKFLAKAVGNAR